VAGHRIGAVFLFALGLAGIWLSRSLPVDRTLELGTSFFPFFRTLELGTSFFPFLISLFLSGLSLSYFLLLFWKGERGAPPLEWATRQGWIRIVLSLGLFVGYVLTLERLGFLITAFLLILLNARMIFHRPWKTSGILALSSVLISYGLLSMLLQVRLPESPWGW
jgi:hypothetical protein